MNKSKKLHTWRIYAIRKKGEYLGSVEATDERAAIQQAFKELDITDPNRQKRLTAQREA
jgi:hypothetical protein